MDECKQDLQTPEQVTQLWARVKVALAANNNPTARQIDRMAAVAGEELAATTIDGWFKTWSVVPTWDRFSALIKALGAEQDEDWRALHEAALTADRRYKREERKKKVSDHNAEPQTHPDPLTTEPQSGSPPTVGRLSSHPAAPLADTRVETGSQIFSRVMAIAVVVVVVMLVMTIVKMSLPAEKGASNIAGGVPAEPVQPVAPPVADTAVRYCTDVIVELAVVYSAPDVGSRQIKFKYLNDEITVSNRPAPTGWISVQTPWDDPGFNWMRTSALAPPTPC